MFVGEKAVTAYEAQSRALVRVVFVGHVDHGKSTLIGRLLHETGSLPDGKLETLITVSRRRGVSFEWSFLLDALQIERDQGITLDTSQIRLRTAARDVVLIDAPGHAELLRNMVTGAAQADAALLIVDAAEGVRDQTRRHIHVLQLLGLSQLAVVINKMDRVGFDEGQFSAVRADIVRELSRAGLSASAIIPVAARHGDGVARLTPSVAWHAGPTVMQVLDGFAPAKPQADLPLRVPVQAVYKVGDRRIVAGRIESGRIAAGDKIVVLPRGGGARVRSIETWPASADAGWQRAAAGRSVGLILDRPILIERGDIIASPNTSGAAAHRLRARVFWLHEEPLRLGATIGARIATAERRGKIVLIENAIDPGELSASDCRMIARNHIGEIEVELDQAVSADTYTTNPRMGRLVIEVAGLVGGGGIILSVGAADNVQDSPNDESGSELSGRAERLSRLLGQLPAAERLARFCGEVSGRPIFTTSFGLEDQAILHMLCEKGIAADIVTLDTGRLFSETYELWAETERRYGLSIRAIYPRHRKLESLVKTYGVNGFYDSREARTACCHARKVEPLLRALAGASAWIVGLRANQSGERRNTALVAADRGLLKCSPLFDWTRDAVQTYVTERGVPINPLHARGFVSIGCAPCTRGISPGEPERAGRWWWEEDEHKECGLHGRGSIVTPR